MMGDQLKTNKCGLSQRASLYVNNRCYRIFEGHNIIGRNPTAAINIKDISISKSHAIITVINNSQHFIADINSSNGTNLNTNVLNPLKLYQLEDNDRIQFADVSALYRTNCPEEDSQDTENTQSSQITEDLYTKLTQQLHVETQRNCTLDNETQIVTTKVADEHTEKLNEAALNSRNDLTIAFHEATTQLIPHNELDDEISFTNSNSSFHLAETQLADYPLPSYSNDCETKKLSVPNSSKPSTSDSTKCQDNVNMADASRENTSICDSNIETSSTQATDNTRDHSQTDSNDSNESIDFMMSERADELESQLHVELLQRKRRTILDTDDDENENHREIGDTVQHGQGDLLNLPSIDKGKVDSDCETDIGEGVDLNADHEELYNDTNVIPPTQEDLSEVFKYRSKSSKPGTSTNHTFESSEDSFRLGLTQLLKDKAETSHTVSGNNTSKSNSTVNDPNDITQQGMTELPGTSGGNQQVAAENDSDVARHKQVLVCSTPIQKDIGQKIKQEKMTCIDTEDADDDVYLANTQCINPEALESDSIYLQPTQKLPVLKKNTLQFHDSPKSKHDNINKDRSSGQSDAEDDIYIESTQPIAENVYIQSTQMLPSKFKDLSRPTSSNRKALSEKIDSVFLAETELIAQNVKKPEVIKNKSQKESSGSNIGSRPASTSNVPLEKRGDEGEENVHADNLNHIYSMETQKINHPKIADTKNTSVCDDNVETQLEVSFSQNISEPPRILSDRPANPLVAILKDDTQEDPVDDNALQKQSTDNSPSDARSITASNLNNSATEKSKEYALVTVPSSESDKDNPSTNKTSKSKTVDPSNDKIDVLDKTITKTVAATAAKAAVAATAATVAKAAVAATAAKAAVAATAAKAAVAATAAKAAVAATAAKAAVAATASKEECSDVIKEGSKLNSKTRMSTRKSPVKETSQLQDTRSHSVRLRAKRSQDSPSVTNESNTEIPIKNQLASNKVDNHTVTLPKKRRFLDMVPNKADEGHSTDKKSSDSVTIEKQQKRKVLTNVDHVKPEPDAKVVEVTPQETSTVLRKSTRSTGISNSSEISLISKNTRRQKPSVSDSKTEKIERPSQELSVELQKSSKPHKQPAVATASTRKTRSSETQSPSDVKVTSNRITTRKRKSSSKSNENDIESRSEPKDLEMKALGSRKRKTTAERLSSADSISSSSSPVAVVRLTDVTVLEVETSGTGKRKPHQEIEDLKIKTPNTRKRKTTLEKFPSVDSLSASASSPVALRHVVDVPHEVQTPGSGKRRKQKPVEEFETTSSSSSENLKSTGRLSTVSTPDRRKRTLKPKVVFTMMDSPLLESAIRHLGGSVVDSVAECTVLVTEKVKRTLKLLTAIGNARPICSPEWIHESQKARQFLDPWNFILRDPEAEEKWNFSLPDSLHKSTNKKIMYGLSFHINATDNVADVLKCAIETCGGKCLKRITKADVLKTVYLVTSQECKSKSTKLRKQHKNLVAIDPEGIFESVLRQEVVLENHVIDV